MTKSPDFPDHHCNGVFFLVFLLFNRDSSFWSSGLQKMAVQTGETVKGILSVMSSTQALCL